jgi:hypothetical protein
MLNVTKIVSAAAVVALAGSAGAQVWPQFEGAMKHVLITFDGTNIGVEIDHLVNPEPTPLPMVNYGDSHTAPADVLDGMYISSQYGFLPDGLISLPQDAAIWVEMTSATAGLEVYEGGMRMMRANHTYAPLFGTGGSDSNWQWNGMMHHPWVAAPTNGEYEASFAVYIGDAVTGQRLTGFGEDSVRLDWVAVPAPASMALLGLGGVACVRRRR